MSTSLLEKTRRLHEDIELYMRAISFELDVTYKRPKEQVGQAHRINECLTNIQECKQKLAKIYQDEDRGRREEIAKLAASGPNMYDEFYQQLEQLQEYHSELPGVMASQPDEHIHVRDPDEYVQFSGEEMYGKCLDLNEFYRRYTNLKGSTKRPYHDYLRTYFVFKESEPVKNGEYRQYLEDLWSYMVDFLKRSNPLFDTDQAIRDVEQKAREEIKTNAFKGWMWIEQEERKREEQRKKDRERKKKKNPNLVEGNNQTENNNSSNGATTNNNNTDAMEIEQADPSANPLYCSACRRTFAKQTVFNSHLEGKKHKLAIEKEAQQKTDKNGIVFLELRIFELATCLLEQQSSETVLAVEKKLTWTWKEREDEIRMQERGDDDIDNIDEDDEELTKTQIKTTIANYPIGWDGKPIPYWLYKLHGLGVEYRCEICGDHPYYGRKAYERHFQEWRHAHGMRCLGIPNTKSFHDIVKINDALLLWEKIKRDNQTTLFRPDVEEEFEDRDGNVFNRKVFEDLRRQGLI